MTQWCEMMCVSPSIVADAPADMRLRVGVVCVCVCVCARASVTATSGSSATFSWARITPSSISGTSRWGSPGLLMAQRRSIPLHPRRHRSWRISSSERPRLASVSGLGGARSRRICTDTLLPNVCKSVDLFVSLWPCVKDKFVGRNVCWPFVKGSSGDTL